MRIPSHHDRKTATDNDAMTPMIDVVFLLLIFFVCASVGQEVELLLPTELSAGSVTAAEMTQPLEKESWADELWLRLSSDERQQRTIVELNDRQYRDYDSLRDQLLALAKLAPESPVILDIGPSVPVGDFIHVFDICREADFQTIRFATSPDSSPAGNAPNKFGG